MCTCKVSGSVRGGGLSGRVECGSNLEESASSSGASSERVGFECSLQGGSLNALIK